MLPYLTSRFLPYPATPCPSAAHLSMRHSKYVLASFMQGSALPSLPSTHARYCCATCAQAHASVTRVFGQSSWHSVMLDLGRCYKDVHRAMALACLHSPR